MTRWEYRIIDSNEAPGGGLVRGKNRAEIEAYLNGLGAEGWEVVNVDFHELESRLSFVGVVKRPQE